MSNTENQTQIATASGQNAPAVAKPKPEIVTVKVANMISKMLQNSTLDLPHDYSWSNALKSAWLILQSVQTTDKKPVLTSCTEASVVNALLEMVVMGLDPIKRHCYFIAHGDQLMCRPSYFGDAVIACRVRPNTELYYDVIRAGEKFSTRKQWVENVGLVEVVVEHVQEFPRSQNELIGAYCGAIDTATGANLGIVLMDMARIKKSWGMGQTNGKLQTVFPDEACLRTVIRRRCKPLKAMSTDIELLRVLDAQDAITIDESESLAALEANATAIDSVIADSGNIEQTQMVIQMDTKNEGPTY